MGFSSPRPPGPASRKPTDPAPPPEGGENPGDNQDEALYAARLQAIHREEMRRLYNLAAIVVVAVIALAAGLVLLIAAGPSFDFGSHPASR